MLKERVIVVDADVLIPILSCDFLLTALDLAVLQLAVTPMLLDQMERHLLSDFPTQDNARLAARADRVRFTLRNHIVADIPSTNMVEAVNVRDRHVAMAAISSGATVVVTNDRRLRGQLRKAIPALSPLSADEFALTQPGRRKSIGVTTSVSCTPGDRARRCSSRRSKMAQRLPLGFHKFASECSLMTTSSAGSN